MCPDDQPSRPTPQSTHGRSHSHGRGVGGPRSESEEYDSLQSDTDTDHATSSRTESSIHLDSATLENHHPSLHLPLDPHLAITLESGGCHGNQPHLTKMEGTRPPELHRAKLEGSARAAGPHAAAAHAARKAQGTRNVHHSESNPWWTILYSLSYLDLYILIAYRKLFCYLYLWM